MLIHLFFFKSKKWDACYQHWLCPWFYGNNGAQGGSSERTFFFLKGSLSQWCTLSQTMHVGYSDCWWHTKTGSTYRVPLVTRPSKPLYCKVFTLIYSRALLKSLLILSPTCTLLSKTSQQTFLLCESARLEKMTYPHMQTKCWKGIQEMWRLK